jgi:hypothetical protein
MTLRAPPRIAAWLLKHLGPSYRNESLAGDLFEEYQLNRTPAWYWRQVAAAICIGRAMGLRKIVRAVVAVPRFAVSATLRFSIEAAALIGSLALAEQVRRTCPVGGTADIGWIISVVAGIALCFSVGAYVLFCIPPALRRHSASGGSATVKRLMGVFAITALSAGTLTWAGSTPRAAQQCVQPGNPSFSNNPSFPNSAQGHANGH